MMHKKRRYPLIFCSINLVFGVTFITLAESSPWAILLIPFLVIQNISTFGIVYIIDHNLPSFSDLERSILIGVVGPIIFQLTFFYMGEFPLIQFLTNTNNSEALSFVVPSIIASFITFLYGFFSEKMK